MIFLDILTVVHVRLSQMTPVILVDHFNRTVKPVDRRTILIRQKAGDRRMIVNLTVGRTVEPHPLETTLEVEAGVIVADGAGTMVTVTVGTGTTQPIETETPASIVSRESGLLPCHIGGVVDVVDVAGLVALHLLRGTGKGGEPRPHEDPPRGSKPHPVARNLPWRHPLERMNSVETSDPNPHPPPRTEMAAQSTAP
jgi:hypothetical protein